MAETQAKAVKNKDILLLQEVSAVQAEIASIEKRREWENGRLYKITQNISATPSYGNGAMGMDDAFAQLEDVVIRHGMQIKQYKRMIVKAENILNRISSQQMRTMVRRLYLDGASGATVRAELGMSRWTFENAREAIENAESMDAVKWHDRYVEDKE